MISFDPFYFLLLLELLLIESAMIAGLYVRERKLKIFYMKSINIIRDFKWKEGKSQAKEEGEQDRPLSSEQPDPPPVLHEESEAKEIEGAGEIEAANEEVTNEETKRLRKTVEGKVEIILEMKNKIEEMEKKFTDMEKEYLILFDQSQKQEEALKQYEGGYKRKDELDF